MPSEEGFAPLMAPFQEEVLDHLPDTICGLWPDRRIGFVNEAWLAFGRDNGAPREHSDWALGAGFVLSQPAELRPFYETLLERSRTSQRPADHDYECSSAKLERIFRMRVHPCASGAFVVVNSLSHQCPHTRPVEPALQALYRAKNGILVQCSNCRRVRRASSGDGPGAVWDWVPAFVDRIPPQTSHGLCLVCLDFYYSDA